MVRRLVSRIVGRQEPPASVPPPAAPPYPEVSLVHWAPKSGARNFGDHLSRVIAACVAAEHGLTFDDEVPAPRRLLGIGSILHLAQEGDSVWGSGWNGKIELDQMPSSRLDIRSVRGPMTAKLLREHGHDVPDVFGDPGLLTRRYFGHRFPIAPTTDFIVVPNLNDLVLAEGLPHLVSPLWGWNRVVAAITRSRFVVSSSLHGLILAENFGIPARLLKLSDFEPPFKFDDYARGTGRDHLEHAGSISEALSLGPYDPPVFDEQALVDAFPVDLWQ